MLTESLRVENISLRREGYTVFLSTGIITMIDSATKKWVFNFGAILLWQALDLLGVEHRIRFQKRNSLDCLRQEVLKIRQRVSA